MTPQNALVLESVEINNKLLILITKLSDQLLIDSGYFYRWQSFWGSLIGALLGAMGAFLVWWYSERRKHKAQDEEYDFLLQSTIVDQINNIVDITETINSFIKTKIDELSKKNKFKENNHSYDIAFFPMFATRPVTEEVRKRSFGSGYIDNKILRMYSISHDLPYIISDIRRQFEVTIEENKQMSLLRAIGDVIESSQVGISTILVSWGYQSVELFNQINPSVIGIAKTPEELFALLGKS